MAKFIINSGIVLEQYDKVSSIADMVSYSSKTNPIVSGILEKESNCLFSIHLENELVNVVDKSRVVFLAQGWDGDMISKLVNMGVKRFIVDNIPDLEVFEDFVENCEGDFTLFLRMKLKEHTLRTEKYFVFGINSEIACERIKKLHKKFPKLKLGIHFHRKTQNMSEWNLIYEVGEMVDEETLSIIQFINIGGGLPSEYANTNVKVIKGIFERVKDFKNFVNGKGIKLIIEPGRFIAAPAGKLITKITRIYDKNIIVDASVYNSDMDALIVPVKLKVLGEVSKKDGKSYVIKGVTPCSIDLFRYRVYLKDVKEGDELIFLNAGAYNFSSDFCNLGKVETIIE